MGGSDGVLVSLNGRGGALVGGSVAVGFGRGALIDGCRALVGGRATSIHTPLASSHSLRLPLASFDAAPLGWGCLPPFEPKAPLLSLLSPSSMPFCTGTEMRTALRSQSSRFGLRWGSIKVVLEAAFEAGDQYRVLPVSRLGSSLAATKAQWRRVIRRGRGSPLLRSQ